MADNNSKGRADVDDVTSGLDPFKLVGGQIWRDLEQQTEAADAVHHQVSASSHPHVNDNITTDPADHVDVDPPDDPNKEKDDDNDRENRRQQQQQQQQSPESSTTIDIYTTTSDDGGDDDAITPSNLELPTPTPSSSNKKQDNGNSSIEFTELSSSCKSVNDYTLERYLESGGGFTCRRLVDNDNDDDDEESNNNDSDDQNGSKRMRIFVMVLAMILVVLVLLFFLRPVRSLVLQ